MNYHELVINYGITTIHPLALAMLIICGSALLLLKRKYAIWPIIIMTCFIAPGQRIVILSLDFNYMRVMIILGIFRIILKNELFSIKKHPIDTLIIAFALVKALVHILRSDGSSALIFELGQLLDIVGTYFVFRCLIQNWEDLYLTIKAFVIVSIPVACFFVVESMTGRNMFSVFGGVPEITQFRHDRMRSQGAFAHPIIAGVFMAVIIPLIAARLWSSESNKKLTIIGLIATATVVIASASSTPVFTLISGIIAAFMFYFRHYMQRVRWGIFSGLVVLHLIMAGPVWHLISRVSAVGGSTSYYRYALIDATINNFAEWWFLGLSSTGHWFWGAQDLTNQFVKVGIDGGIWSLILFVAIIALAFRGVGRTWRRERKNTANMAMAWAMGVSLFALCMSFIGVAVWGQLIMLWYMLLAIIASLEVESVTLEEPDSDMHSSSVRNTKLYSKQGYIHPI